MIPPKVKIYNPTRNVMQSGKANTKRWLLEYETQDTRFIEPMMGWTGNRDTNAQLRMRFNSKEEAIAYAERKKLNYVVIDPEAPKTKLQSYSDNFK